MQDWGYMELKKAEAIAAADEESPMFKSYNYKIKSSDIILVTICSISTSLSIKATSKAVLMQH